MCSGERLFVGAADGSVQLWHPGGELEEKEVGDESGEPERRKKEKWRAKKKVCVGCGVVV